MARSSSSSSNAVAPASDDPRATERATSRQSPANARRSSHSSDPEAIADVGTAGPGSDREHARSPWRGRIVKAVSVLACLTLLLILYFVVGAQISSGLERGFRSIRGLGTWKYVVVGVLFLPAVYVPTSMFSVVLLASGFILGFVPALITAVIAVNFFANVGAVAIHFLCLEAVQRKVAQSRRAAAINRVIEKKPLQIMILLRIALPTWLSNYTFGSARVDFWKYAVALFWGEAPVIVAMTFSGSQFTNLKDVFAGKFDLTQIISIVVTIVIVVTVCPIVAWYAKREMRAMDQEAGGAEAGDAEAEAEADTEAEAAGGDGVDSACSRSDDEPSGSGADVPLRRAARRADR